MKEPEKVEILIDTDGTIEIKVNGVKGTTCTELTEQLTQSLKADGTKKLTEEYYENEQEQQNRVVHRQ